MHLTCKRYKLIRLITPLMCFSPPPLRTRTNEMSGRETIRGISVLSAVKKLLFLQGWAQINGRDDIPIPKKVEYDEYYLNHRSFFFDLKIFFLTFLKVARAENVSH